METEKGLLPMSIIPDSLFRAITGRTTAAIGAFDGVHLGHQRILTAAVNEARARGIASVGILFDPLPSQFFGRVGQNERILLRSEQEARLKELGIDHVIVIPFTQEFSELSPDGFLEIVQEKLHFEKLFMGNDFSIGKQRSGGPDVIRDLGQKYHFEVEVIPYEKIDGQRISSTVIRDLLRNGEVGSANRMLGYPFYFTSRIIHGEARGRKLGFPTLNVKIPEEKIKLPNGVYAVINTIEGKRYPSVTNIGVRPTFGMEAEGVVVESFLLHASGSFYGDFTKAEFIEMLRPEIRFDSADALRAQIQTDTQRAEKILANVR